MKRNLRRTSILLGLVMGAALSVGALAAEEMAPAGSGVTFMNEGKHNVTLFTRFGPEAECGDKAQAEKVAVKAGESASVQSGDSGVCYCMSRPDRLNVCPTGWFKAEAGAKLRLR